MLTRRRRHDRGAVAAIVAMLTVALFGLAAIVVDLGMARDRQRMAQNAADAAALGAATVLSRALDPAAVTATEIQQARTTADQYAAANGWAPGIATFTVDPVAATVTIGLAPMQSPAFFAGAIGASVPSVAGRAQASWRNAPAPCALCVLGNLSAQNGQTVNSKGSILVRGSLTVAANGTVATSVGIVGVGGTVSNKGSVVPPPVRITPITDPYGVTPRLPPGPPAPPLGSPAGTATTAACMPGTYDDITSCRTFASGIYVVTGQNKFSGNITVTADSGVLFYVTCSARTSTGTVSAACAAGQQGGTLEFAGTVSATITALPDPAYRDLAVIYDRNNTSTLGLIGGPDITVNGGVYAASATLRNNGTGPLTLNGTMVVGAVDLRGVPATVNINEQNAFADVPPFLVHLTA